MFLTLWNIQLNKSLSSDISVRSDWTENVNIPPRIAIGYRLWVIFGQNSWVSIAPYLFNVGLGHEAMSCAVCLFIFLCTHEYTYNTIPGKLMHVNWVINVHVFYLVNTKTIMAAHFIILTRKGNVNSLLSFITNKMLSTMSVAWYHDRWGFRQR